MNTIELGKRAAEALKANLSSVELKDIWREINQAVETTDRAVMDTRSKIDRTLAKGEIAERIDLRKKLSDLEDAYKVLYQMRTELHNAEQIARGEEAVRDKNKLQKKINVALNQARKAKEMLIDSERVAREIANQRSLADRIGVSLMFEKDSIRELCALVKAESNPRKQLLLELGGGGPRHKTVV